MFLCLKSASYVTRRLPYRRRSVFQIQSRRSGALEVIRMLLALVLLPPCVFGAGAEGTEAEAILLFLIASFLAFGLTGF